MELKANVKLHNRFDIEVRGLDGELKQTAQAENIVLDSMWTRLCNGYTYFGNIHYGSGTGILSASRTSLFTHKGTATATTEEIIRGVPNTSWKRKIVLAPETAVGVNITEVGIAYDSSSSNLVTHAMLKDSEGNQISIEKTNTDVVTIYATVYITITNSIEELRLMGLPNSNYLINYLTGSGLFCWCFSVIGNSVRGGCTWFGFTKLVSRYTKQEKKDQRCQIWYKCWEWKCYSLIFVIYF